MSQVSRRVLDKVLEDCIYKNFINTIANLKGHNEINNFINDLLSPVERTILIKRLAIALMVIKGYTYEQIDHTLKVSKPTIKNVSILLKYGKGNGLRKSVDKILSNQKKEEFFDKIEQLLLQVSPKKMYNSPSHNRKKRVGKELFIRRLIRNRL